MIQKILKLMKDEGGQTLAEYLIAVIFIGLAALVAANLFPQAIRSYLQRLIRLLSLPIP